MLATSRDLIFYCRYIWTIYDNWSLQFGSHKLEHLPKTSETSGMKTIRNILLLVLGLAMIQSQASAASKHYLVEGKGKRYLVETESKTKKGKGAEKSFFFKHS